MSTEMKREFSVRVLPPEETYKLWPVYEAQGQDLPPNAVFVVVELGGRIIASCDIPTVSFVGLMNVKEEFQNTGVGTMLAAAIAKLFKPGDSVFMVTDDPAAETLAERNGMVRVPGKIWRRDF